MARGQYFTLLHPRRQVGLLLLLATRVSKKLECGKSCEVLSFRWNPQMQVLKGGERSNPESRVGTDAHLVRFISETRVQHARPLILYTLATSAPGCICDEGLDRSLRTARSGSRSLLS